MRPRGGEALHTGTQNSVAQNSTGTGGYRRALAAAAAAAIIVVLVVVRDRRTRRRKSRLRRTVPYYTKYTDLRNMFSR